MFVYQNICRKQYFLQSQQTKNKNIWEIWVGVDIYKKKIIIGKKFKENNNIEIALEGRNIGLDT